MKETRKIRIELKDAELEEITNIDQETKKIYTIKTKSGEEEFRIADSIHNQLVGNKDYIDCNIILNMSKDRNDNTENQVNLYVFNDSNTDIEISIYDKR